MPEFGADLDNVKPAGLIAAAAVVMLAAGLPLSGGKTFGNAHVQLPSLTADALAMVGTAAEIRATSCHGVDVFGSTKATGRCCSAASYPLNWQVFKLRNRSMQGQCSAQVRRQGKKLNCGVQELNGILRL